MKEHWNLTYLLAKVKHFIYLELNPKDPWIPAKANKYFKEILTKDSVGVEFGSGRSTVWIANKVKHLISIENHKNWHSIVSKSLEEKGVSNVDYRYCDVIKDKESAYTAVYDEIENDSLDFVFVDGKNRGLCALKAVRTVRKGGWIIVDDVQRYIPSKSTTPRAMQLGDAPLERWANFIDQTKDWKCEWFSNGISDTAFFQK